MEVQKRRVENRTRKSSVSSGVNVVDASFEHLTVLRVLIEGLAGNEAEGFWLKNVHGIPVVPRISPLDLVYLDKDQHVLEVVELLPASEFPAFRSPAVTALVLPFQSVRASGTAVGDQLDIRVAEAVAAVVEDAPVDVPALAPAPMSPAPLSSAPIVPAPIAPASMSPAPIVPPVVASIAAPPAVTPAIVEADPELVAAADEAPPPRRDAADMGKLGARQRKHKAARLRAQKNKQAAPRAKDNSYRHTPFIVESAASAGPAAPTAAQPAAPAARTEEPTKPRPAEAIAAKQPPTEAAAKTAKTAKAPKPPKPVEASRVALPPKGPKDAAEKRSVREHLERLLKWLSPNSYSEERRASIRRPAQELVVYTAPDGEARKFEVGNISSTGIYVRTEERWEPGANLELTLQRSGPVEQRRDRRMDLHADAVRCGNDGVGLQFDFPEGMHLDLWECAVRGKTYETGPEYIVQEMRMARALGTIRRICPEAADDAKQMLHKEFSNVRVASAVRIAYIAEEMLAREAGTAPRLAPAELVKRILETGSWSDTEWIQQMWGGLLASSCSADGEDMSNGIFIDMLSQLAPVHLRILGIASERAEKPGPVAGPFTVNCCTAAELTKALDLSNLTKTLRSVQELADMGLVAAAKRSPSDPQDENAKTAITPLGLEMYTRCHGRRFSAAREEASGEVQSKEPARLGISYSANAS